MLKTNIEVPAALGAKIRQLSQASAVAPTFIRAAVRSSALDIVLHAKEKVPVMTGELRRSIKAQFLEDGFAAVIGSYLPYAAKWEFSVVPHPVKPLSATGKKTGNTNPDATWGFMRKALAKERPIFLRKLISIVEAFA